MSENEPHPSRTIQLTPQLVIILALVFLMLTIPVAATIWLTIEHFREVRAERETPTAVSNDASNPANNPALRAAFEAAADTSLGAAVAPLDSEESIRIPLRIVTDDPAAKRLEVFDEVAALNGTAIPMASVDPTTLRALVMLPAAVGAQWFADQMGEPVTSDTSESDWFFDVTFVSESSQ